MLNIQIETLVYIWTKRLQQSQTEQMTNPTSCHRGCPILRNKNRSYLKTTIPWVRKKNWSQVPDGGLIPGQTGRLIVSHKVTLTVTAPVEVG
jgi:hypothetical protein